MENTNIKSQKKALMSSKEVVARARKFYKENFKKLWPLYLLGGLGSVSFSVSSDNSMFSPYLDFLKSIPLWAWIIFGIVSILISIFLFISKISLLKSISDTNKDKFVSIKDSYKKGMSIFWTFISISIVAGIACTGALMLFIVPGIILAGYLSVSTYELVDKQKKGFSALLGSWALVSGYWWDLFIRSAMIGLRIIFISLLYSIAILIPFLLLFIPGMVLGIKFLMISGIVLACVAGLGLFGIFSIPLFTIATFELYYNLCEIQEAKGVVNEELNRKRKSKLWISVILGIIAWVLIMVMIYALVIYYKDNAKYIPGNPSASSTSEVTSGVKEYANNAINEKKLSVITALVEEIKAGITFPYKVDELTTMTSITAQPNAIRYSYDVAGDTSNLTDEAIKKLLISDVCSNKNIKAVLDSNINFEYSYLAEETQKTFFITISKADCL